MLLYKVLESFANRSLLDFIYVGIYRGHCIGPTNTKGCFCLSSDIYGTARVAMGFVSFTCDDEHQTITHQTMTTVVPITAYRTICQHDDAYYRRDLKSVYVYSPKVVSVTFSLTFHMHIYVCIRNPKTDVVHLKTDLCWQITGTQIMFACDQSARCYAPFSFYA